MLTSQKQNFAKWYNEVVLKAGLAEYSAVKGCMIIKPYGYAIWENIQKNLDREIKKLGAENAYFPLFIPEKFLKKEAEHIKGFAPEVAWVTQGGRKKLEEKLAVRPTSETIIYDAFARWIHSYRDLPVKINQWANIVRWEMRPRLFLRTLEFLWQEGHTAHATSKEAAEETKKVLKMYYNFIKDWFAIYSIVGMKTESEKFAGALYTLCVESLMKDNKVLQMGTSHNLGQNFSKAFGIKFLDEKGKQNYAWQTSWGVSTRLIGGLIMSHGDDRGLVLPPKLAPFQVVIVPIMPISSSINKLGKQNWTNNKERAKIKRYISKVEKILGDKKIRFNTDWQTQQTPGWKFNDWELKGVPLRIEIGSKEAKKMEITFVLRSGLKRNVLSLKNFSNQVEKILDNFQKKLLKDSEKFTKSNTRQAKSFSEFKEIIKKQGGFVRSFWCGSDKCEKKIQEETKATIRCIPFRQKNELGKCVKCGKRSRIEVLFARAY